MPVYGKKERVNAKNDTTDGMKRMRPVHLPSETRWLFLFCLATRRHEYLPHKLRSVMWSKCHLEFRAQLSYNTFIKLVFKINTAHRQQHKIAHTKSRYTQYTEERRVTRRALQFSGNGKNLLVGVLRSSYWRPLSSMLIGRRITILAEDVARNSVHRRSGLEKLRVLLSITF